MSSSQKESVSGGQSPADYGYGHGGYSGYGYGYGDEEGTAHRSLQDYLLILRERIWYIIVVFLVVFSSALVYTVSATKIYESTATVQLLRDDPNVIDVEQVIGNEIRGTEDLNTQVKLLESISLIETVAGRLSGDELRRFLAPYQDGSDDDPLTPNGIIAQNREIAPQRLSLVINVNYRHPDPEIAAIVANYLVEEYINFNTRQQIEESIKAVQDLKVRADEQKEKVDQLARELQSYREENNMVSLDERRDIVTDRLKALGMNVTESSTALKEIEVLWTQLNEREGDLVAISELPFVAVDPLISSLKQQISAEKIAIAELQERYRAKHPRMIEAQRKLDQTEAELVSAIRGTVNRVDAQYQAAQRSLTAAQAALVAQEEESLDLSRAAVDYDAKEREFVINQELHNSILSRMRETSVAGNIGTQNARIIDKAQPIQKPVSPNLILNLGLGLVGGAGLGLAFAFFVAFIDDRVKSSFDIESVVGLPLIGIIPQIKKLDPVEKAQVVLNNADRQVAEAFLTLHSALRLKEEAKDAKCILTTSTIPGEGKSFVTTNVAFTFAAHGEKVAIIDCDLRKPNIHKTLQLENARGVIDIVGGSLEVDDVINKEVVPNLDVITTGGRAKNPTQVLNSRRFEQLITDLRKRYDRVFVDTPPLAAVSDAMVILPLVDGSLFSIFFNKVRRKAAQFAAKKLLDSNVPVFGAVLNGLNLAVSGYYYAQYYDKSYKDYYVVMSKKDDTPER